MQKVLFVIALLLGAAFAYVDSRPTWDDPGVTAGAIVLTAGVFGFLGPKRPWLWALAIGAWIPLLEFSENQNYGSLFALGVAFAGSYLGMLFRRSVSPFKQL